jgi:hypothetical protein
MLPTGIALFLVGLRKLEVERNIEEDALLVKVKECQPTLLDCLEMRNWKTKFINENRINKYKKVAHRKG